MQNSAFKASEKILLYYPTIDISSPQWIRHGLMYWDKIGSIVPESYSHGSSPNSRYSTQIQLVDAAGLFRPYDPKNLLRVNMPGNDLPGLFIKEVRKALRSRDFIRRGKKNVFDTPLKTAQRFDTRVYPEKVFETLHKQFIKEYAEKRDDGFYYFEKNTAFAYMAILAKYLAVIDDQFTIPSTDDERFERLSFKATEKDDYSNPCLLIQFRDVLRVPANNVEIKKVIDFRLKRNDELLNFREQVLDKFEDEIKKCSERKEIQEKTVRFKSKIERGIKELDQIFKESKVQTIFGTLKSIIKPSHFTSFAGGTAVAGATGVIPPVVASIGIVAAATVEISDYFVSRKNLKLDNLRKSPYSYLYLAEKEFKAKTDFTSLNLSK